MTAGLNSCRSLTRHDATKMIKKVAKRSAFLASFLFKFILTGFVSDTVIVAASTSMTTCSVWLSPLTVFTLSSLVSPLPLRTASEMVVCFWEDFRWCFFRHNVFALAAFPTQSTRLMYMICKTNRITAIAAWPLQKPIKRNWLQNSIRKLGLLIEKKYFGKIFEISYYLSKNSFEYKNYRRNRMKNKTQNFYKYL